MLKSQYSLWPRPVLRWAGSKRRLLPTLMACVPDKFDRYIEPFLGSACLFLALQPKRAVLGDFNQELMAMYRILTTRSRLIAKRVHAMPDNDEFYYQLRAKSPLEMNQVDRAARFIYLNRYCFNGVYRTNRSNQFNVPRGRQTGRVPSVNEFIECGKAFRGMDLRPGDFEDCLADVRSGDFVYLDPPYASVARLDHGEYGYNSFKEKDIDRLITTLKRAANSGATVLLSYADVPMLATALPDWHRRQIVTRRFVGGFNDRRANVVELLMSNQPLLDKLH